MATPIVPPLHTPLQFVPCPHLKETFWIPPHDLDDDDQTEVLLMHVTWNEHRLHSGQPVSLHLHLSVAGWTTGEVFPDYPDWQVTMLLKWDGTMHLLNGDSPYFMGPDQVRAFGAALDAACAYGYEFYKEEMR